MHNACLTHGPFQGTSYTSLKSLRYWGGGVNGYHYVQRPADPHIDPFRLISIPKRFVRGARSLKVYTVFCLTQDRSDMHEAGVNVTLV